MGKLPISNCAFLGYNRRKAVQLPEKKEVKMQVGGFLMEHNIRVITEVALDHEDEVRRLITRCALAALACEQMDTAVCIDVTIVDDDSIRALNAEYRGKDSLTDVLSFPLYAFHQGRPEEPLDKDPESGRVMLGDVVLGYAQAVRQAKEFGHSTARECGFLTVHSVLHLLGYDHEQGEDERKIMRQREEAILAALDLTREEA